MPLAELAVRRPITMFQLRPALIRCAFLALLAAPAASQGLSAGPVVDTETLQSWADFVRSESFREQGLRCGTTDPKPKTQFSLRERPIHTSLLKTVIRQEYEPEQGLLEIPVVFVEVGYTSRPNAAVEPWTWPDGMQGVRVDEHEQDRALAALTGAAVEREWLLGFFVWRYYANLDDVSQEAPWGFSPHAKPAERTLGRVFGERWAADPTPPPWKRLSLAPRDRGSDAH